MKIQKMYEHSVIINGKEYPITISTEKRKKYNVKEHRYVYCTYCNKLLITFNENQIISEAIKEQVLEHEENCYKKPGNNICFTCKNKVHEIENDPNGQWVTEWCALGHSNEFYGKSKDCVDYKKNF